MADQGLQIVSRNPDDDDDPHGRMGFLEHLDELRTRIIRACLAIGSGMLVSFFFVDRIGDFVLGPTLKALPQGEALIFTKPGEGFAFYVDLALMGGVVLAAPFVTWQAWRFIAPGLYARERRLVVPFMLLATAGTLAGAVFTHYVMFPAMIGFLATFHSPAMKFVPRVEDTFELYKTMLLGMVAVFQIPTLVLFLAKAGIVDAPLLWRNIKYAILAIFIVAAVLTPSSDPWNQAIFAAPMIALYLIGIVIAWCVGSRRRADSAGDAETTNLRLVIGAMAIDQARRPRRRAPSC